MADKPGDERPTEEPKCDQAFFLDLAAKGKEEWNKWRRDPANKDVHVTFAGVDFSESPRDQINFEGFEFCNYANFSGCKWRGGEIEEMLKNPEIFTPGRAYFNGAAVGYSADFTGAAFGDGTEFSGAAFGSLAFFSLAAFGEETTFAGAALGSLANFTGATFDDRADFTDVTFCGVASFTDTAFGNEATFIGAAFGDEADFTGAAFGDKASFFCAHFKGRVEFTGKSDEQWTMNLASVLRMDTEARIALEKRHRESWKFDSFWPDRFLTIRFGNARFDGEADFSGRSFEQTADFTGARFHYPPNFDNVDNASRIDFAGASVGFVAPDAWHWTKNSVIPVRLRAFRKIAEETKNHDLERDLYIEERKAERGVYLRQQFEELKKAIWMEWPLIVTRLVVHVLWIFIMFFYWAISNYGRNFVLPAAWLIASVFFFYWRYTAILTPLMHEAGPANADKYNLAVWMLALGNAVPFVGPLTIDAEIKKFLFCLHDTTCQPIPPEGYQLLVIAQNVISIILVFFIGLALRNYFRIK